VWSSDITYVAMARGFPYLVEVIDRDSRCVLASRLSNTLDGTFCIEALEAALAHGEPAVFNTDHEIHPKRFLVLPCRETDQYSPRPKENLTPILRVHAQPIVCRWDTAQDREKPFVALRGDHGPVGN
jgi:transposase InsO family protein